MTDPKAPASIPQNTPITPPKEIVWMTCRAGGSGCGGNQAYISLMQRNSLLNGGGTSYRYRCTKCNGVWHITR